VLLSSHILSEVEKVCDTVTIIRNGTDVESGTLDELRHLTRTNVTALVGGDPSPVAALPGVHDLVTTAADDGGTRITFDADNAQIGAVLSAVTVLDVRSFTATPPSLEELFMRHYGDVLDADVVAAEAAAAANGAPAKQAGAR